MSVRTIADHMARKQEQSPQYDFLWRVELPSLDIPSIDPTSNGAASGRPSGGLYGEIETSLVPGGPSVGNGGASPIANMDDLNHRVYNIDVPFYSFDAHRANGGNYHYNVAHHKELGELTITMDEFEDGKTLQYINDWTNLILRPDGTFNPPAMYKKNIILYRLSATKLDLHVSTYSGCFIQGVAPLNLSQEGDGVMQYAINIMPDKVKHDVLPEAQVRGLVAAAEAEVMSGDIGHQWFKFGGVDEVAQSRILDRIIDFL